MAPGRRENLVEVLHRVLGNRRQLAAAPDEGVGRQHAGPARVGEDGEVAPLGPGLLAEHLGHVEEVVDVVHPQHAAAAEGRVQDRVAAGKGAGVGGRGLGGGLRAPGLDDDDRLALGDVPRRRQERARVPDRLHVEHNALGLRVVAEIRDHVAPVHVEHRPDGDERAKAHVLAEAPVEDGREKRPALTHERDVPFVGHRAGEGGVEAVGRPHDAQAIRPHDADVVVPGNLLDLALQLGALFPHLPEPGGDDDESLHARLPALLHDAGDRRRGRRDHGQVDVRLHGLDVLVRLNPKHAVPLRVDREDGAAERIAHQVPEQGAPHASGRLTGPDDRDVLRLEDGVERLAAGGDEVVGRIARRGVVGRNVGRIGHGTGRKS